MDQELFVGELAEGIARGARRRLIILLTIVAVFVAVALIGGVAERIGPGYFFGGIAVALSLPIFIHRLRLRAAMRAAERDS